MSKSSSWFSKILGNAINLENLECVLVMQLRDLASAEEQLVESLPRMVDAATSLELKHAFQHHLDETLAHQARLDEAFRLLGKDPDIETCEAMEGLIAESDELIALEGDAEAKDAALIAAAQRIEHYEIAGYGCARTFAHRLGHFGVAAVLQETLNEEHNADRTLTRIAESGINAAAAQS